MTMNTKHILLGLLGWLLCLPALGQNGQNVESIRIAYITRQLNLTPEEAQQFWPVYNQYQDELKVLKQDRRRDLKPVNSQFSTMSDKEVEEAVENLVLLKQREHDLFLKYHEEFKKVLPIRKVGKLYKAENEFREKLLKRIQDARQNNANRQGGGPGGNRGGGRINR